MTPFAAWMLTQEARALLTRLARVKPFALVEAMPPAANLMPSAQVAIERHLAVGRRDLDRAVRGFIGWLRRQWQAASAEQAQRRFTLLRLQFNAALTQFDLFSDVITQRSEHESGVWLSGLDVVAADALTLPGGWVEVPPIICYLDRGAGIASSLVHEVGHQGAALLDLVASLRPVLQALQARGGPDQAAWRLWERWISEIVADFWAVARVGIASTQGLMAVVSLPRAFVFRVDLDDPHPAPWIRVLLSCAIGQALYPHPQWARFAALWSDFYPPHGLDAPRLALFDSLRATMPAFVALVAAHRPRRLRGHSLAEVLATADRRPARLARLFRGWSAAPQAMYEAAPALVFAVLGQARADGQLSPEDESALLAKLLTHWALASTLAGAARCAHASGPESRSTVH